MRLQPQTQLSGDSEAFNSRRDAAEPSNEEDGRKTSFAQSMGALKQIRKKPTTFGTGEKRHQCTPDLWRVAVPFFKMPLTRPCRGSASGYGVWGHLASDIVLTAW